MPKLAHHVFFTLQDRSDTAVEHLVAQCKEFLTGHDGLVSFEVGRRVPDLNRPVNMDFDVSLHTVFESRQAHDTYQTHARHLQFIENNKPTWASVSVCDSDLAD